MSGQPYLSINSKVFGSEVPDTIMVFQPVDAQHNFFDILQD